tara:strand:+ start:53 stop:364 length:312 start_codon:yes stop_codon:yes gene_type:complete
MSGLNKNTTAEKQIDATDNVSKNLRRMIGDRGAQWVEDTSDRDGNFYAIQGIDSAVLDMGNSVFTDIIQTDSSVNISIPNGTIIYLRARKYKLASGKAIMYNF